MILISTPQLSARPGQEIPQLSSVFQFNVVLAARTPSTKLLFFYLSKWESMRPLTACLTMMKRALCSPLRSLLTLGSVFGLHRCVSPSLSPAGIDRRGLESTCQVRLTISLIDHQDFPSVQCHHIGRPAFSMIFVGRIRFISFTLPWELRLQIPSCIW